MTTIATCGHQINKGNMIEVKDHDREGNRCISYRCVCDDCLERYKKDGYVLSTKEEIKQYLKFGM